MEAADSTKLPLGAITLVGVAPTIDRNAIPAQGTTDASRRHPILTARED